MCPGSWRVRVRRQEAGTLGPTSDPEEQTNYAHREGEEEEGEDGSGRKRRRERRKTVIFGDTSLTRLAAESKQNKIAREERIIEGKDVGRDPVNESTVSNERTRVAAGRGKALQTSTSARQMAHF